MTPVRSPGYRGSRRRGTPFRFELLEDRQLLAIDLVSVSPGDSDNPVHPTARAVDVDDDLEFVMSEEVVKGSGEIQIRHHGDNALVEAIDVGSARVSVVGNRVVVDPVNPLPADASLYVTVDASAFRGTGGAVGRATLLRQDFDTLALENSTLDTPLDDYIVSVRGQLEVNQIGAYTFGVHANDGQALAIDVAQDGFDYEADLLIYDDAVRFFGEDRLHTCGALARVSSCPGVPGAPALLLEPGTYDFEYRFFDRTGDAGGEFFYAPGFHNSFSDAFKLVGDASGGIDVTAIKATMFKAPPGLSLLQLGVADAIAQTDFIVNPRPQQGAEGPLSQGRDASLRVDRAGTLYSLEVANGGFGYAVGDRLEIAGELVGGENGEPGTGNDILITVTEVDPAGGIQDFSAVGVAEDPLACPGTEGEHPSECLDRVNLAEQPGEGRFVTEEHAIPGGAQWQDEADVSRENWAPGAPAGWVRDQAQLEALRPGGPEEYAGWSFLDKDFWVSERADPNRARFELGEGTVALVDPNGYHQGANVDATGSSRNCLTSGTPEDCGFFSASLATPRINLVGAVAGTATLEFDSSWWDEDTQAAEIWVEYFNSSGERLREDRVLRWDSVPGSEFHKPAIDPETGADTGTRNEHVRLTLANPAGADAMQIRFQMPHAQNDWWWAIDNVEVSADVRGGQFFVGIQDNRTWRFLTQPTVRFDLPEIRIPENTGSFEIDVSRVATANNAWPFEVNFTTVEGTATRGAFNDQGEASGDFVAAESSVLEFSSPLASQLTQSIFVTVVDDDLEEGDETFRVTLSSPAIPQDGQITARILTAEILVTIVDDDLQSIPGDINGDGTVNFPDFLTLAANFNKEVAPNTLGDLNGDGRVTFPDFLVLAANYGKTVGQASTDAVFAEWADA